MSDYILFILVASATIISPGPGVFLTVSNAIRFGVSGSLGGICGIAFGTFIVAAIIASSLGLLLATSVLAFTILKYIGALYLVYLGVKLWHSPLVRVETCFDSREGFIRQFVEGVLLQITNPKALFFFFSVFPQFVDLSVNYIVEFSFLVFTYSGLVITIHLLYALLISTVKGWFDTEKNRRFINRVSGSTFVFFGIGLAASNR